MRAICIVELCGRIVSITFVIALAIIHIIILITLMDIFIVSASNGRRLVLMA